MGRINRWRRWLYRRVIRLQGTPHAIAWGMAIGVFIGFLMPPGLQLVVALPLALLLRGNVITAGLGTVATNPLTFVPFYFFTCKVGEGFLHLCGASDRLGPMFRELLHECMGILTHPIDTLRALFSINVPVFLHDSGFIVLCWIAGGTIVGLAAGVVAYYLTYWVVIEFKRLRSFAHERRVKRRSRRHHQPEPSAPATHPPEPDEEAPDEQPPPSPDP